MLTERHTVSTRHALGSSSVQSFDTLLIIDADDRSMFEMCLVIVLHWPAAASMFQANTSVCSHDNMLSMLIMLTQQRNGETAAVGLWPSDWF